MELKDCKTTQEVLSCLIKHISLNIDAPLEILALDAKDSMNIAVLFKLVDSPPAEKYAQKLREIEKTKIG